MRPIQLRASGFTCFRDDQPALDFSDLELFAISGPTGAGKSSVLDAMTYALFGKVPRMGGTGIKELISHGRDRMTVTLTFAVNGDRFMVTRTTRRTGAGVCQLDRQVGAHAEPVASGVTQVNEAIGRLLGLDYDAFTQAVMLPQGEFARFLKGAAADRRKILQELLRLTVYNRMREIAGQRCGTARTRVGVIEQQLQGYAVATPEAVAHMETERSALETSIADVQRASDAARRQRDELAGRVRLAREQASRRKELEDLLAQEPAQQQRQDRLGRSRHARQLSALLDQLDRDEAVHASRVRDAKSARGHLADVRRLHERALAAHQDASAACEAAPTLRGRIEALRSIEGRMQHRDACVAELRRLAQTLRTAQAELKKQRAEAVERQRQLDDARVRERQAEAAVAARVFDPAELAACERGRDHAAELRRDRLEVPAIEGRLRAARTSLAEARRVREAEAGNVAAATAAHARAVQEREEAWSRQRAVWDAHRAMTLRSHLEPGHTCPVCEQTVATVPPVAPPPEQKEADAAANETAESVRQVEIQLQQRQQDFARAAAGAVGAEADVARVEQERATVGDRIASTELLLRTALARYLPPTAERMPEHWLLERLDALRVVQAEREAAERARQVARETAIGAEGALALAVEKRDACAREIASLEDRHGKKQAELEVVSTEIAQVTTAEDPRAELAELASRLQRLEGGLADAASVLARHEVALATATTKAEEAERVTHEAAEALERISVSVARSLREFGFLRREDARAALLPEPEEALLQRNCDEWTQQRAVLAARVAELDAQVGPTPATEGQLHEAEALAAEADRAVGDALRRRGELDAQLASMRQRLEESAVLRTQLAGAQADHETYSVLASDLQANAFQDWLLTEVFERIVRGASTRLMDLTSRYTLEWVDNEFYVVDHDNARERRTADTLSGGETFLASLALALELSEQVQRAAGAVRLDSLFIDEGFGSLDANAQDVVANAIESLQVTGRMVGIITHIRELTDRMPACIVIDKRPDGSRWSIAKG